MIRQTLSRRRLAYNRPDITHDISPLTHPTPTPRLNSGRGLTPRGRPCFSFSAHSLWKEPNVAQMRHRSKADSDTTMRQTLHATDTKTFVPATTGVVSQLRRSHNGRALHIRNRAFHAVPRLHGKPHARCAKADSATGIARLQATQLQKTSPQIRTACNHSYGVHTRCAAPSATQLPNFARQAVIRGRPRPVLPMMPMLTLCPVTPLQTAPFEVS